MPKHEILSEIRNAAPCLSVGVLTADWMNFSSALTILEQAGIRLLHIDVMDGRIWPKITVGSGFVQGLRTPLLKDVHLLIEKPEDQLDHFVQAGAQILSFSAETCRDLNRTLKALTQRPDAQDMLIGLSLNPATPVDMIAPYLDDLDFLVLLTVGPDTGSRTFLAELPQRLAQARTLKPDLLIFVDGGIKKDNLAQVAAMGPDVIVTGSAVFDGKDPVGNLKYMLNALQ